MVNNLKTGNQDARTWKLTMREEKTVSEKNLMFYKGFSILDGKLFNGICVDYYDISYIYYGQLIIRRKVLETDMPTLWVKK